MFNPANDTVLRLPATLFPLTEADARVSVFLNSTETPFTTFSPVDVIHDDSGIITLILPRDDIVAEINTLRVCATSSPSTDELSIQNGTLGVYQQPRFDEPGSFSMYVNGNPILGDEIEITLQLTNHGGEAVNVNVDYRKFELESVPLLKGQTGFDGRINPGQTQTISYRIKPLRAISILLPPAVLTYTNIFGENITQFSERAFLEVNSPPFNVSGAFLVPKNRVNVGETLPVEWVVQNEGIESINGVSATFFMRPSGTLQPAQLVVETLSPSMAHTQSFNVTFSEVGTYVIGCTLASQLDTTLQTNCQSVTVEVVEENSLIAVVFSLVLLLIAMGVYVYIYILPQHPVKQEPAKPAKKRFQT